jgi:hypothetical protein
MSPPTKVLQIDAIHKAIDEECSNGWRRSRSDDVPDLKQLTASPMTEAELICDGFKDVPLYFFLVHEMMNDAVCGVAVVSVEYSTWEGRVLFINRLVVPSEERRLPILQILAKVAVRLGCVRLVWQVKL